MSSLLRDGLVRRAGLVEATLLDDRLHAELIADGVHLPSELIALALKAKGAAGCFVVSDAMRGAGAPDGDYTFGAADGTPVRVANGISRTIPDGGLASTPHGMDHMVRHLRRDLGLDWGVIAQLCAGTPAACLGLAHERGSLAVGRRADAVILDAALQPVVVLLGGRVVRGEDRLHD